jgi:hypothetical protein
MVMVAVNTIYYFEIFWSLDHQDIFTNLEKGTCSANNIRVVWGPTRLTNVLDYIKYSVR